LVSRAIVEIRPDQHHPLAFEVVRGFVERDLEGEQERR
jgi:hypothetical protein